MTPTIGRIVLFQQDADRDPLPACIFGVRQDLRVDISILRAGMSDIRGIPFSEYLKVGHWSWMPVEEVSLDETSMEVALA